MLGIGHRVANNALQEDFEHAACLFVHEARDALHAAAPSEPSDRRLRDPLDVVAEDLAATFGLNGCCLRPLWEVGEAWHVVCSLHGHFLWWADYSKTRQVIAF
eukprot:3464420-Prymnesium_polylepis.1